MVGLGSQSWLTAPSPTFEPWPHLGAGTAMASFSMPHIPSLSVPGGGQGQADATPYQQLPATQQQSTSGPLVPLYIPYGGMPPPTAIGTTGYWYPPVEDGGSGGGAGGIPSDTAPTGQWTPPAPQPDNVPGGYSGITGQFGGPPLSPPSGPSYSTSVTGTLLPPSLNGFGSLSSDAAPPSDGGDGF